MVQSESDVHTLSNHNFKNVTTCSKLYDKKKLKNEFPRKNKRLGLTSLFS